MDSEDSLRELPTPHPTGFAGGALCPCSTIVAFRDRRTAAGVPCSRRSDDAVVRSARMEAWEIAEGFGLEHLRLVDRPEPAPGPRQIRLRILARSLNYR